MKVALLGATGFVGSALLKEALDRGHVVTAIVRHPEKLEKSEGLTAKAGDVYDTASLVTLIRGKEAIISAFNPGWKNPNLYDDQVRYRRAIAGFHPRSRRGFLSTLRRCTCGWLKAFAKESASAQTSIWPSNATSC